MSSGSENGESMESTFGLCLNRLADLFAVAAEERASTEVDSADEGVAEMLHRQLTTALPGEIHLTSLAGRSLLQVLLSSESSIRQLQAIKELSKGLTASSVSEAERAVATTIYYAVIASCLQHRGKKITQNSYEKLDESFALLLEKRWMARELVPLFSEARRICASMRGER